MIGGAVRCIALAGFLLGTATASLAATRPVPIHDPDGSLGLRFSARLVAHRPVELTLAADDAASAIAPPRRLGYNRWTSTPDGVLGVCDYRARGTHLRVVDRWHVTGGQIRLDRAVRVLAGAGGGFASAVRLGYRAEVGPRATAYAQFMPGILYGSATDVSDKAIGRLGADVGQGRSLQVREDRLPIPMTAVRLADGTAFAVLDPRPDGATTAADAGAFVKDGPGLDAAPRALTDARFAVGAITTRVGAGQIELGFAFPATETPMTYRGNTYPDAGVAATRVLSHPLRPGVMQRYSVVWRVGRALDTPALIHDAWRWAWATLEPVVHTVDIEAARRAMLAQLSSQVEVDDGRYGITNFALATDGGHRDAKTVMGFTGKALEVAEQLLWGASAYPGDPEVATWRRQGEGLFATFTKGLALAPPAGEGFDLKTGAVALAIPDKHRVYLRSFGDDIKATLRAYRRELRAGRRHDDWLAWARGFGDWLLTQQRTDGAVPRAWAPGTGAIIEGSGSASYNAVPLWLLLTELTGDQRYRAAAIRAGDYGWTSGGQRDGRFSGGTIDNPNVIDKEAATLSLEAYLALFEATRDPRWLTRARAAADVAETWIYAWDVPTAADDPDAALHWKHGVPTTGVQLIATGHSLVDEYMAFDVGEFAKLARYTNDPHYLAVARLLLHDTLAMTALPGRTYDLMGPGWQQEHWSLAPWRGRGMHRGWLPWVTTSHLHGIMALEEDDPALYAGLAGPSPALRREPR